MSEDKNKTTQPYKVYSKPNLTWVNITSPSPEALAEVKGRFPFLLDIDIRDCLPPYQRPKLMERKEYLFAVLLFPAYYKKEGRIKVKELDIFIGPNFLITSHTGDLEALQHMAACYDEDTPTCPPEKIKDSIDLLHAIIDSLYKDCFPMLTHVANDLNDLEKQLFDGAGDIDAIKNTLRVKTNIVDFRKAMQGHKRVLEKFIAAARNVLKLDGMAIYYEDLRNHTKEIWEFLENDQSTINTIFESHTSLINYETSQATKALSALALIIFPTTLVAAVFAMDSDHMPIRGFIGDWWIMLGFVTATATTVLYFLRRRNGFKDI